ncbi:RloB domain-containing protein [bacterium]|nr:RloB domain-containing protein [bacterium]
MELPRRKFTRKTGFRDAKLIVVASEGEQPERNYFDALRKKYSKPNLHLEFQRERDLSLSAPRYVLEELNSFRRKYSLNKNDELWMIIDKDNWTDNELNYISRCCIQKNYNYAISNPCFELWLLLHITDVDQELITSINNTSSKCRIVKNKLNNYLADHGVSINDCEYFITIINEAIHRAQSLEDSSNRWPQGIGTQIHHLIERLI